MRRFTSVAGLIVLTAKPEEVGLSSARLARITETLKADVERGRMTCSATPRG